MCEFPDLCAGATAAVKRGYQIKEFSYTSMINILKPGFYSSLYPCTSNNYLAESGHVYINNEFRGTGLGQQFLRDRMEIWRAIGLKTVIASVEDSNERQKHILTKYDWINTGPIGDKHSLWRVSL